MAYQDQFYTLGTVSVEDGSPAVVGSGTGWETALITGGVFYAEGAAYPILSVESETNLTLAIPYIGATASGLIYAIDRQRSEAVRNVAMNDRLAQIIREITIGNIEQLNALSLAARQILQTDADGNLKLVNLAANQVIATDNSGDVAPINLGTLGRALLALATGTTAQYVQGDGTLQAKIGLPVSTATQTALNLKANLTGASFSGDVNTTGSMNPKNGMSVGGIGQGKVYFYNNGNAYVGEMGVSVNTGFGNSIGFYNNVAGNWSFNNNLSVSGSISKGSGTFLIDHPVDPYNRNLRHGFVEAPRYDLIYRGTVRLLNGRATVDIGAASNMSTGTFAALTTNAVVTSLQNQDGFARLKPGAINGGTFEIICEDENCTDLVSWVVIAERNDPFVKSDLDPNTDSDGRFVPEFEKEDA